MNRLKVAKQLVKIANQIIRTADFYEQLKNPLFHDILDKKHNLWNRCSEYDKKVRSLNSGDIKTFQNMKQKYIDVLEQIEELKNFINKETFNSKDKDFSKQCYKIIVELDRDLKKQINYKIQKLKQIIETSKQLSFWIESF